MKTAFIRYLLLSALVVMPSGRLFAKDFMVQFLTEHYKQTNQEYSNFPEVYHSIQVITPAGPKVLILSGKDYRYRTWLRQFIAEKNSFIVKVPDEQADAFIAAKAFEIDVTAVHPYTPDKWGDAGPATAESLPVTGGNRILVVDDNVQRSRLLADVIDTMGYTATVFREAGQAFKVFKQQPDKFEMIIVDHQLRGLAPESFVRQVLAVDHAIPIIVGAGYQNQARLEQLSDRFATDSSVRVVPVLLKNLRHQVTTLLKGKV